MEKRTFKVNDCLGNIPNAEFYDMLIDYARYKGVPVYSEYSIKDFESYPNLIFYNGRFSGNSTSHGLPGKNWITFEQFFEYCNNWKSCQTKEIVISTYGAKATIFFENRVARYAGVDISFDTIRELFNAISEPNITE